MTTAADDRVAEEAFEACLAGRPVPGGAAHLAAFTGAVRDVATQPGRPNAALAELLTTGLLLDQSSPSARTAPMAGKPHRASRVRIRRRFTVIFPVLIAKFLSAGAVAQAATGAGIAVVVVAGAGTAGVLPDPVQDTFTSLVSNEEVVETPDDGLTDVIAEEPVDEDVVAEEPAGEEADLGTFDPATWELGPQEGESFGSWVSQAAGDEAFKAALKAEGLNFGTLVQEQARAKGLDAEELEAELETVGITLDELAGEEAAEDGAEIEQAEDAESQDATTQRETRGKGKGKGAVATDGSGSSNGSASGRGNGRG